MAANCGQIAELIRDGETGLLHAPGDLNALVDACDALLRNPKKRLLLGQSAAEFVRANFTWDRNASRAVELARALIERRIAAPAR